MEEEGHAPVVDQQQMQHDEYRCPFGPPSPARARACPGPVISGPCLARPYSLAGRAGSAHGLRRRPRHGPAG